jgi:hypothetical protein
LGEFLRWSDKKNPEVAKYLRAFKSSSVDPRNAGVENGYAYVYWFYTAAEAVGFGKFSSATLMKFMNTAHGVHIPLSRTLSNPGLKKFPQRRQPYGEDGWVYGY